ncbi:MAG: Rhodanese-like domain-containing protein [Olpidium bornovanus]|uniref:Rhodanese-like domain-containing protein n=1 Tax=Olpidium bornovanus TaxID=278681 RepID=A0A8H8A1G9_9FUNG|nr:MAG: Rhodanese-like domain-containing protein [Olpidium bornovanus]
MPVSAGVNVFPFSRGSKGSADKVTLIDVRNPDETAHGVIPTAKLLPFPELQAALDPSLVTDEDFQDIYGFARPDSEDNIVFYCRSGVRSHIAASLALAAGYTR